MEFDNPRARKSNRIRIPDAIALFHGTAKTLDRKFHHVHVKYNEENKQLPIVNHKRHLSELPMADACQVEREDVSGRD